MAGLNIFPKFPKLPRIAGIAHTGPELKALKGPGKPIPGDQQKELEDKWRAWQATLKGQRKGSASILEYICWAYLTEKKRQKENVDFFYQYPLAGGRTVFGGFVADFYFPVQQMVWNPAGLQFHYTKSRDRANDILSKIVLANRGIKEIFLYEDDLMNRPDFVLSHAWRGEEVGYRQFN